MRKLQASEIQTTRATSIQTRSPRGSLGRHPSSSRSSEYREREEERFANVSRFVLASDRIYCFRIARLHLADIHAQQYHSHARRMRRRARADLRRGGTRGSSTWSRGVVRVTSRDALTADAAGRRDAAAIRRRRQQHPRRSPSTCETRKRIDLEGISGVSNPVCSWRQSCGACKHSFRLTKGCDMPMREVKRSAAFIGKRRNYSARSGVSI